MQNTNMVEMLWSVVLVYGAIAGAWVVFVAGVLWVVRVGRKAD